jgi:D-aspartate ligase
VLVRERADLSQLRRLRYPVVLKPINKRHVHTANAPSLIVCNRLASARAHCERLLDRGVELIAQDWIDGEKDQIYFCLFYYARGEVVAMFTGRKLASSPPAGTTAYCVGAPEAAPELEPMTRSFIEKVGYAGMGGLEFKWDKSTGRFLIIEPTVGRTDLQHEISALCGVNIPLMAYRYELGLPQDPPSPVSGKAVWRASVLEPLKGVRADLPQGAETCDGYWRRDDPLPALARYSWGVIASASQRWRVNSGVPSSATAQLRGSA